MLVCFGPGADFVGTAKYLGLAARANALFDDLSGTHQQRCRDRQSERVRSPEVDRQIEFVGALDWQLTGLGPPQNFVHKHRCAAVAFHEIGAIT